MGMKAPQNSLIRPVGMAFGVATIVAIATMFVPVALLESITGSTGVSEMIPATAAPLGDTARAIMAFLVGAFTLAAAMVLMLRPEKSAIKTQVARKAFDDDTQSSDRVAGLKARMAGLNIPKIAFPKMPWVRNDTDILDLADLPKLRAFDAHPDAPARRPLSASSDLAEPIAQSMRPIAPDRVVEDDVASADIDENLAPQPVFSPAIATEVPAGTNLADMVAQLEAAVIQRKAQLAELEIVAAKLSETNVQSVAFEEGAHRVAAPEITEILPPESRRSVLEAVPSLSRSQTGKADDQEMDAALSAALDTLQRMNAQAR
jgi:hypothetical protein